MNSNVARWLSTLGLLVVVLFAFEVTKSPKIGEIAEGQTQTLSVGDTSWTAAITVLKVSNTEAELNVGMRYNAGTKDLAEREVITFTCVPNNIPCTAEAIFNKYPDKTFHFFGTIRDDKIVINQITREYKP